MGKYFNIGDAWRELKDSYGAGETAAAAVKLLGKGISNTAVFGATELIPGMINEAAKKNGKVIEEKLNNDTSLSEEEREKLEKMKKKSNIYVEISELKDKVKNLKKCLEDEELTTYKKSEIEEKIAEYENNINCLMEQHRELRD